MRALAIRVARRTAWILLVLTVVAVNLVAAALFYVRSDSARNLVLSVALAKLQPALPGGVTVARSEGDLTRGLVLYDVVIRDREQVPAISAERIEVRYTLLALLAGVVKVDAIEARGVTVVSRALADGRDNLATLGVPGAPPKAGAREPMVLPVSIVADLVDVEARFVRLPNGGELADAPHDQDARGTIRGRVYVSRRLAIEVAELGIELDAPTPLRLHAKGTVKLGETPSLRGVSVHVDADPRGLHRKVPGAELRGPIVMDASADGAFDNLRTALRVGVSSPSLKLAARGRLRADEVELQTFTVKAPFADIDANGTYRFDRTGEGTLRVRISDLAALQAFGAPPLAGRIKLDGHVLRNAHDLSLEVQGEANDLVVPGAQVKRVRVDVAAAQLAGHAKLDATGVVAGGLKLKSVALAAEGNEKAVHTTITAAGNEGVELDVALAGVPRIAERRLTGFEATLQRLRLRAGGSPWEAEHPAHVSADFDMHMVALGRLRLVNEQQQVTLEGRVMGETIEGIFVDVKHFDLSQLPGLLSPGHVLPHTDLSAEIEAHGPLDDPEVAGNFSGEAHGKSDSDLIHASGNGDARLAHGRLAGKVFVTIGGQKADSKFDIPLPLRPGQPIAVSFDASVLLSPTFAEFLVPKLIQNQPLVMYALGAKVTAQGQLTGTTSEPELHASARVARWAAGNAHGDLGASFEYSRRRLSTSATLELSSLPAGGGTGGGVVALTAELPMDLSAALTGGHGQVMKGNEPMHAELKLKHVGLDHLPFQAFNVVPPVQHGWVDGQAELAGNRSDPQITASFDAVGLTAGPVSDVDLHGSLRMKGGAATADTRLSVHGSEAFRVHGSLDAGKSAHALESGWRKAPLAVSLDINDFDLGRLGMIKGLSGTLRGRGELTGSLAQPRAKAEFGAFDLRLGQYHHKTWRLSGNATDGVVTANLFAELDGGQSVNASVGIPFDDQPLRGELTAHGYSLDFGSETLPLVRLVRGLFEGELKLSGTRAAPRIDGAMHWSKGEVHLATTAMTYRDIDTKLEFSGEKIVVPSLHLLSGTNGKIEAAGTIALERLLPIAIDAKITARQFPIQRAGVGMLLDAEITLVGKKNAQGILAGTVRVGGGNAQLPDQPREHSLLSTASLEDVKVIRGPTVKGLSDSQAPRAAAARGPNMTLQLDGPFEIRGEEVSAVTRGNLTIDLSGAKPEIHGTLSADPNAWVKMFGQRYDVERGKIRFEGGAEPILDFRLSQRMPKTRIGVEIKGPATKPELMFWSDPPIYDATQVVGVMLAGSPTINGVSTMSLSGKSNGVISRMVVISIHKNFLSTLPIDVFRFDGNQARASNPGSQIELGKYLTESLYVGYAYQIGAEGVGVRRVNHNEARVDYHFSQRGQLEARGGDGGVGGLDLFWTFRP